MSQTKPAGNLGCNAADVFPAGPYRAPVATADARKSAAQCNGRHGQSILAADVWDFVSRVSDAHSYDRQWTAHLAGIIAAGSAKPTSSLRIADFGGGAGNPSIGLSLRGHEVVVIDNDLEMLRRCRRRAMAAAARLQVASGDLRAPDAGAINARAPFDVICCLGNALGYLDSWPSGCIVQPLTAANLASIFRRWSSMLSANGFMIVEVATEPSFDERVYHRNFDCLSPEGVRFVTEWCVRIERKNGRSVDTTVYAAESNVRTDAVTLRIDYRGHIVTNELVYTAGFIAGLQVEKASAPLRNVPLTTFILRSKRR